MHTQVRNFGLMVMAFCLALTIGAAGTAFADETETPTLVSGVIAENPEATETTPDAESSEGTTTTDPEGEASDEPEAEPVHENGWEKVGSSWTYWQNNEQLKGRWIATKKTPRIKGIPQGKHRYWIDKYGKLAINRVIDPDKPKDQDAGYCAYATKWGFVATTGKKVVGNKVYLVLNDKGKLASGDDKGFLTTRQFDNKEKHIYYIDPATHAATTGEPIKVKGFGWVYAYAKKGYLLTGLQKVDKTHLVLAESNGKLYNRSGFLTTATYTGNDRQRYYLERTKKYKNLYGARIGSFKVNGQRFLGQSDGTLYRNGYKLVNGNYYHADGKGALTYNGVISNMYKKAQGYSSPSQYLIMVDVNDTKFIVFEGSQGNWKVKYIWDCSTGAPWTPTPIGVWQVGIKGYSFGHGYTCYYYTQFNGDYLIHTRIYEEGTHILRDAAMNTQVSQGCVRLYDEDAYWVYQNVPAGTTVVTIP